MLPGLNSAIPGIGKLKVKLVSVSTVRSANITCPTVAAGDIAFISQYAANQSNIPGLVVPSGFINVNNVGYGGFANEYRVAGHYKVMNGTESGTTLTGMTGARDNQFSLLVLRLSQRAVGATVFSPSIQVIAGDVSPQTINATGITKPALFLSYVSGTGTGTLPTNGAAAPVVSVNETFYYEVQSRPLTSRNIDGTSWLLQSFGLALDV